MAPGTFRMGELTAACGVSDQAVRLYERLGLLEPVGRTAKGYRLYDAASVETVRLIKQAQRSGFTLEAIKVLLRTDLQDPHACGAMKTLLDRKLHALTARLAELQGLKEVLQDLRQACEGAPGPGCPAILRLCTPCCAEPDPEDAHDLRTRR